MTKFIPIAFCLGFVLVHALGCTFRVAPDVPGPATYCVVPDGTYEACDSSHPWVWGYVGYPYAGGFCMCDEVCGETNGGHCVDGTVCATQTGLKGTCKFVPGP